MTPRTEGAKAYNDESVDEVPRETELLARVASTLAEDLPAEEVLRKLLQGLTRELAIDRAEVYLLDETGGSLAGGRAVARRRDDGALETTLLDSVVVPVSGLGGMLSAAVVSGKTQVMGDAARPQPGIALEPAVAERLREGTIVCVPLSTRGRVTGVVLLHDASGAARLASRVGLIEALVSQAGPALDRAGNQEARERALKEITRLQQVGATLQGSLPLDEILGRLLEGITEGLEVDRALLLIHDERKAALEGAQSVTRGHGGPVLTREAVGMLAVPVADPFEILSASVMTKRPYLYGGAARGHEGLRLAPQVKELLGVDHLAAVPLLAGNRVIGVITLDNVTRRIPITADLDLMSAYGAQAGLAIERTMLEEKLRASERRHREFIERSPDGIVETSLDGRILSCNDALVRLVGYSREELVRMRAADLYADPARREEFLRVNLEKGSAEGIDVCIRRKGGSLAFVSISSRLRRDSDPPVIESIIHDVTERYETERRSRVLADAVTYSADAILSLDAAARVTSWNKGAEKIFGYTAGEMLSKPYQTLVPPDKLDELCDVIRVRVEKEGYLQGYETVRLHKDGRRIPVSVTVSRLGGNGGPDLGWSAVVRDITDRKREESRRLLLSSITEQSPDAILSVDAAGRITSWNRGAEKMFGYSAAEVIGEPWLKLAPVEREADYNSVVSTIPEPGGQADAGESRVVDTLARARDGRMLPVRISSSVLRAHADDETGFSIILRDLTEQRTLAEMSERLQEELFSRNRLEGIVGVSRAMDQVRERIRRVARFNSSVLLVGDSGTGKEIVASAIHYNSPRGTRPLIKVNCAAIPEHLLESELFGIERNVATGVDSRMGRFEMADGGTLFLDEIGDMTLSTQAKILRVLQEREFEKVGGKKSIKVDVRIVAATNKDLEEEIKSRRFRDDLYYRLNVIVIKLPPLSSRREDIDALIDHFIDKFARENHLPRKRLTIPARILLNEYDWPGNVRELEHSIERAMVMSEGAVITESDLPPGILIWRELGGAPASAGDAGGGLSKIMKEVERRTVLEALERSGWVQARAAKLLGISERSMWYRVKKLGLRPPAR